jgi:hypothetical protein
MAMAVVSAPASASEAVVDLVDIGKLPSEARNRSSRERDEIIRAATSDGKYPSRIDFIAAIYRFDPG